MIEADVLAKVPAAAGLRLQVYAALLQRWQPTVNLVAPSTLPDLWGRHIADSLQVQAAAPEAKIWLDFGSGGGFPGLVTAILLADIPGAQVHLVESDKRKASFLKTVSRETGAPVMVHAARIEAFNATFDGTVEAVSARALAPLAALLDYAGKYLLAGAVGVFPKGQRALDELTAASLDRRFVIESVPSQTQESARVLIVRAAPQS